MGPRSMSPQGQIFEECPRKETIDFATAPMSVRSDRWGLGPRCIDCDGEYRMAQFLKDQGLLLDDNKKLETCKIKGCTRIPMYRSTCCGHHVFESTFDVSQTYTMSEVQAGVNQSSVSGKRWTLDGVSGFGTYLDREDDSTLALDLEGQIAKGNMKQVAAVRVKGRKTIWNLVITDPIKVVHQRAPWKIDRQQAIRSMLTRKIERKVFMGDEVPRAEMAQIVKNSGIRPTDLIWVWSKTFTDYSCFKRNLVEQLGEEEVNKFLPPKENVIRLHFLFKHNLPGVYCGLEQLFHAYFPTDQLRLIHHDAEIDDIKLIKMGELAKLMIQGKSTDKLRGVLSDWPERSSRTVAKSGLGDVSLSVPIDGAEERQEAAAEEEVCEDDE